MGAVAGEADALSIRSGPPPSPRLLIQSPHQVHCKIMRPPQPSTDCKAPAEFWRDSSNQSLLPSPVPTCTPPPAGWEESQKMGLQPGRSPRGPPPPAPCLQKKALVPWASPDSTEQIQQLVTGSQGLLQGQR